MKKFMALALLFSALGGCALGPNRFSPPTKISAPYDASEAKKLLEPGKNTISGSALMRQRGGGVVTCAGNRVELLPATSYTTERMGDLFGSSEMGYIPAQRYSGPVSFDPDPPEFRTNKREVLCDAQGMFEFKDVADGDFYLSTRIVWMVRYARQGGLLMQRVTVKGGEIKKVVLAQ